MPRLPGDCSGQRLVRLLERQGYVVVRHRGSHIRLQSTLHNHAITVPDHSNLRVGTLNNIRNDVVRVTGVAKDSLVESL